MPARLRDIKRALAKFGVSVEEANGTSHYMATREGRVYPLAAHNGLKTEIADHYLKGVCRAFEIDFAAFKKEL